MNSDKCVVDGYEFLNSEDGGIAREEVQRIRYISSKLDENNSAAVLSVYNKMVSSNTFMTPVGIEYLRSLQKYLYSRAEIEDALIKDIPVTISYRDIHNQLNQKKDIESDLKVSKKRKTKTFIREYKMSLLVNLVLACVIAIMFWIMLKADTPNMINYENAITNRYASWEQELTERENAVREREAQLME